MSGPVVLVVLDGFGIGDGGASDATALAHTPFFARTRATYPSAQLETSGEFVGLPPGQMGNSEVGHMTMGSGRIHIQDITRITQTMAAGGLANNVPIQSAIAAVENSGGTLHLMGLLSDGGVHSEFQQLTMLLDHLAGLGIQPAIHAFMDGRDTPPHSGEGFMRALVSNLERTGGHVATVTGRYYAMDRDVHWDRTERAYNAIVCREGRSAADPIAAVEEAYRRGETDEFIEPTVIDGSAPLVDGDAVIFFNFRADRARQITNALTAADPARFSGELERKSVPNLSAFVCLTEYDADFGLPVAFPSEIPSNGLGEIIAAAGLQQLRVAETEKYAHVTFFFNGGREPPYPGEDRRLIDSPRIATYDLQPEMSAPAVADAVIAALQSGGYEFIVVNFANGDMVGHTAVRAAVIEAVEVLDREVGRVLEAAIASDFAVVLTADHGNCDEMVDPVTGEPHTQHSNHPVPCLVIDSETSKLAQGENLSAIAPTVLQLMGLAQPPEMSGHPVILDSWSELP